MAPRDTDTTITSISNDSIMSVETIVPNERPSCNDKMTLQKQSSSLSITSSCSTSSSSWSSFERDPTTVCFADQVMIHTMAQHTKSERAAMFSNDDDWYRMRLETFRTVQTLQERPDWVDEEGVVIGDHDDQLWETHGNCIRGLESMRSKAHHEQKTAKQRLHVRVILEAQQLHKDNGTTDAAREARLALLAQHMSKRASQTAQARARADEEAAKKESAVA